MTAEGLLEGRRVGMFGWWNAGELNAGEIDANRREASKLGTYEAGSLAQVAGR